MLLWIDRHQWFSGDEWDFLVRRGVLGHSELGLLEPHNEHWSTFPVLIYRALFSVFGVRTYTPYLVMLIVAHLLAAHLLWRLMMRYGVDWLLATGAAAVFMVLGAGWEDLINAFQVTFVVRSCSASWRCSSRRTTGPSNGATRGRASCSCSRCRSPV